MPRIPGRLDVTRVAPRTASSIACSSPPAPWRAWRRRLPPPLPRGSSASCFRLFVCAAGGRPRCSKSSSGVVFARLLARAFRLLRIETIQRHFEAPTPRPSLPPRTPGAQTHHILTMRRTLLALAVALSTPRPAATFAPSLQRASRRAASRPAPSLYCSLASCVQTQDLARARLAAPSSRVALPSSVLTMPVRGSRAARALALHSTSPDKISLSLSLSPPLPLFTSLSVTDTA